MPGQVFVSSFSPWGSPRLNNWSQKRLGEGRIWWAMQARRDCLGLAPPRCLSPAFLCVSSFILTTLLPSLYHNMPQRPSLNHLPLGGQQSDLYWHGKVIWLPQPTPSLQPPLTRCSTASEPNTSAPRDHSIWVWGWLGDMTLKDFWPTHPAPPPCTICIW